MSESTSSGSHKPDPDEDQDPDQDQDSSFFSDPTAPVWADPTAALPPRSAHEAPAASVQDTPPVRPAPPAPPGAAYPYGQQPAGPQGSPPPAPPMSNPYAQQPPVQRPPAQQYGQQAPAYGQQPPVQQYGAQPPAYGAQPPGFGQQPYQTGTPTESNVSAIVLTILSALGICNVLSIGPLVLGIIALTKNSTDPEGSRHLTKIGWIVFAVVWVVGILVFIGWFVALVTGSTPRSRFDSGI